MKTLGDHLKSILVGDSSPSPRATVKVTQTPIAWWDPTTKKGGRLTVFRSVSSRSGTSYSYRGDGASGSIRADSDAEAIEYVERHIVHMQSGKLKRAG